MLRFLKQNFERLGIVCCLISLGLVAGGWHMGPKLMGMAFGTLALYYLLSGAAVLYGGRVQRMVRLAWFVGMWSLTLGVIGVAQRLAFNPGGSYLLVAAASFALAVMVFAAFVFRSYSAEERPEIRSQFVPLVTRLLPFGLVFFALYTLDTAALYRHFGYHRTDATYTELKANFLDHPDSANHALMKAYEEEHFKDESAGPPEEE